MPKDFICDLHIHTKYDIGCSPNLELKTIAKYSKIKGVNLASTGSFTHRTYLKELKNIFSKQNEEEFLELEGVYFLPATEVNNVFEDNKKRRIHNLIIFSNLEECEQFNDLVEKKSYLGSDGRLCLKLNLEETLDYIFEVKKEALFIPAHIWTPWYGIFGSKSGYNNLKEAFGKKTSKIYAVETGLSSDPAMNWRCDFLDNLALVSFSDAHSPENIGREATVIELNKPNYKEFFYSIKNNKIKKTIEFFPQEGKYYQSGCRKCAIKTELERCPKCNKKIAQGVLNRIKQICGNKKSTRKIKNEFCYVIPLKKLIAAALDKNEKSKAVEEKYLELILNYNSTELDILVNLKIEKIKKMDFELGLMIEKMRTGQLKIEPGYDGVFGKIQLL
ncbi:MAG: endonuclease Q family protein [Candidatus Micrarchaeota archaeon]|nr:endonuclease Q family protein [Candidatus Micrarchaeota archaeon]